MAEKNKKGDRECPIKKTSIGGQALIEGIMMRGPRKISMAVRNPEGEMVIETWEADNTEKPKYYRWPFFRGVFGFIDSMRFGYKCLMRSAEIAGLDSDAPSADTSAAAAGTPVTAGVPAPDVPAGVPAPDVSAGVPASDVPAGVPAADASAGGDGEGKKKSADNALMGTIMVIASVLGVALAIVLFKFLPELFAGFVISAIPALKGEGYGYQLIWSLIVGAFKILIVVGYMALVSLMKDIKRTFMYHGAEHKSITCYESGLELTVDNVRAQRRFHPRCGTSFLILIVLVGILITMFIPTRLSDNGALNIVFRSLISIALLPLMMSLGYELIRLAGRHDNILTRMISAPGVWLQRITTKEPEDAMIECAITALKNVIPQDNSDDWDKK